MDGMEALRLMLMPLLTGCGIGLIFSSYAVCDCMFNTIFCKNNNVEMFFIDEFFLLQAICLRS
jgi:hypothetical protein